MGPLMSHEDAQSLLAAEALDALDALDAPTREALRAHIASCPDCTRDIAALRDTAAALAHLAPASPRDEERAAASRARLVARAAADRREEFRPHAATPITPFPAATPPPGAPRSAATGSDDFSWRRPGELDVARSKRGWSWRPVRTGNRAEWLAAAAILVAVALAAALWRTSDERASLRRQIIAARTARAAAEYQLAARDSTLAELAGGRVRVVSLTAGGTREPSARMFWNQDTNGWTFIAHDLPRPGAGRTYQLWLVTRDGRRISAGTFEPSTGGTALVRATYALARDALGAVAVTEEPAAGSAQPTTQPFLIGSTE